MYFCLLSRKTNILYHSTDSIIVHYRHFIELNKKFAIYYEICDENFTVFYLLVSLYHNQSISSEIKPKHPRSCVKRACTKSSEFRLIKCHMQ